MQHLQERNKVAQKQSRSALNELPIPEKRVQEHHGNLGRRYLKRRRPQRQFFYLQVSCQAKLVRVDPSQLFHFSLQVNQRNHRLISQ